jgi:tryptophan synthase alpha chain
MGAERYTAMFSRVAAAGETAFVPFFVLGDPRLEESRDLILAAVEAGADGLELGLPFSDPIADGPAVQAAVTRSLAAGTRIADALAIVRTIRDAHPTIPIGLLVYANLIVHDGVDRFAAAAASSGVDSVVIPDVPSLEQARFAAAFRQAGIALARILPPNADPARLAEIARSSEGYVYVTSRAGVTGADATLRVDGAALVRSLHEAGAAPALLGFGVATPEHVRAARVMGVAGTISGSAVVSRIASHDTPETRRQAILEFVSAMKAATRATDPPTAG